MQIWQGILTDLGLPADGFVPPAEKISVIELKKIVLSDADRREKQILREIFGCDPQLSGAHKKLILALRRGVAPDGHATDTGVYNLRKIYGADFIKKRNGKYEL